MVIETIEYYVSCNSSVDILLNDASKAFDRLCHHKLFDILMKNNVCPLSLRLLSNIYTQSTMKVKWNGVSISGPSISGPLAYGGVVWVLVVACVRCYYAMPINTYVSINKKPFRVIPCSILVKTDFSDRQLIIAV